jgi:hypothetical protein
MFARPSLCRELKRMNDEGLLQIYKRRIKLLEEFDINRLEATKEDVVNADSVAQRCKIGGLVKGGRSIE